MALFEWDPDKDRTNRKKHGISFEDAQALLEGADDFLEIYDGEHSDEEERFIAIGPIRLGIVVVVYTERHNDLIRIVSARKATKKEVELFRKHHGGTDE